MNRENLRAGVDLALRYLTITEAEIDSANGSLEFDAISVMRNLTGFSSPSTCSLCKAANYHNYYDCSECLWNTSHSHSMGCVNGNYVKITQECSNSTELVELLRKRAALILGAISVKLDQGDPQ
jgi:hypothetical protein